MPKQIVTARINENNFFHTILLFIYIAICLIFIGAPCLHNTQFNSKNQEAFDAHFFVRQMPLDKRKNF